MFAIVFVFHASKHMCNCNEVQFMYLTPCLNETEEVIVQYKRDWRKENTSEQMSLFHVYIIGLPDSETMATNSSKVTKKCYTN